MLKMTVLSSELLCINDYDNVKAKTMVNILNFFHLKRILKLIPTMKLNFIQQPHFYTE